MEEYDMKMKKEARKRDYILS